MKTSPTVLSLRKMRKEGYTCAVVEKRIPKVFITKDLFDFVDILCIKEGETVAIQTTSYKNHAARRNKIFKLASYPVVLSAGWRVVIHGWHKIKNKWICREEELGKTSEEN